MPNDDLKDWKVKDNWSIMKHVAVWFIFFVMLGGSLMWGGLIAKPAWLSLERKAFVASHQYIEGKRTAIATYIAQCRPLHEGAQKQELRQRIAAEKSKIPQHETANLGVC